MSPLFGFIWVFLYHHSIAEQCLSEPPEFQFVCVDSICTGDLQFISATFTIPTTPTTTFTTRVYNDKSNSIPILPGPTLKLKRGYRYDITFSNELKEESPDNPNQLNVMKDPNTTNLHTHGLHISGEAPSDSVFVSIAPQQHNVYQYSIPCDHSGGLHWYHPHHHGSTALQVGGGAYGAIIVEDDKEMEGLPDWYTTMNEFVAVIGSFNLRSVNGFFGSNIDYLFKTDNTNTFYLINGQYQPQICLNQNEWMKLRILHVDIQNNAEININSANCKVYLLAKDGVIVHGENNETPRLIESNTLYLSVSSRVDIAILCSVVEEVDIIIGKTTLIGTITIHESNSNPSELTTFNPIRPRYLQSLLNYDGEYQQYPRNGPGTDSYFSVNLGARTTNGQIFTDINTYLVEVEVDNVHEWNVKGAGAHPFHIHVNHFQIISGGNVGPIGWTEQGDWIDTLTVAGNIRFYTDTFGGSIVLHCHILEHEDQGAMAIVYVNDGCNADMSNGITEQCNPSKCINENKIVTDDAGNINNDDNDDISDSNVEIVVVIVVVLTLTLFCGIGLLYKYCYRKRKKIFESNIEIMEYGTL